MKRVNNAIKLAAVVVSSMGLTSAAVAEHHENAKVKAQLQVAHDTEVELYDYHAGIMYTGTLQHFIFHRHLENLGDKPEDKHAESTQIK